MTIPKPILADCPDILGSGAILVGYRGSIAHDCYIPSRDSNSVDDKDVMSICVPPIDYYLGYSEAFLANEMFPVKGVREIKNGEWDIVVYEARKFIRMLAQGNPNVLMMLWLNQQHYLKVTSAGQLIISNKHLFVGRHVYKSFTGYAYGQLHRMTHCAFNGHMGEKRKALVEKYGFDVKNAGHLIRLLRMSIEFLKDGELQVARPDAQQLLEIKHGEWTLERVLKESDRLFALAQEAYVASTLPKEPDYRGINALCIEVVRRAREEALNG